MTTLTSIKQSAIEDTGFSVGLTSAQATAIAEERGLVVYATPANLPSVGVDEGSLALVKSDNSFHVFIDTSWESIQLDHDWSLSVDQAKLTASDAQTSDQFGQGVTISSDGNYIIVGAYGEDTGGSSAGAAYVFTRSGSTWTEQAILRASDAQANDRFAFYAAGISSDGTYAVISAYLEDGGAGDPISGAGAAYIFTRSGSTWTQQAKITASDAQANDNFGYSVSINSDGSYVVVGSAFEDTGGYNVGAAYIYSRSGSTWTQQTKLTASDASYNNRFGNSVALNSDGSYLVIGAYTANDTGAAYVFTRSGSTWTEQQKIQHNEANMYTDYFGWSVAINALGDVIVVGAFYAEDDGTGLSNNGFAYIFTRSGSTWKQEYRLVSPAGENSSGDNFGRSVSINNTGNVVVVGAPNADTVASNAGSAYAFNRSPSNTWTYSRELTASDAQATDYFGWGASISGDGKYIVVGAYGEDAGGSSAGAAYVFHVV